MRHSAAEILREYGPFPGLESIHGVSYDGERVWFASGDRVNARDPDSGTITGAIEVPAHAGTAFDGMHLYQIAESVIRKIDRETGEVLAIIPTPGRGGASGLAWAEGSLWVGQHRDRKIHQIDPETGAVLRTIVSDRFVTGVSWVDGELWHGTWEEDASDIRRIDPENGEVHASTCLPESVFRAWRRMVATVFSAAAAPVARFGWCAGRGRSAEGQIDLHALFMIAFLALGQTR